MAKYSIKKQTLDNISNAIREKTGTSDKLSPDEMANAIPDVYDAGRKSLEEELLEGAW